MIVNLTTALQPLPATYHQLFGRVVQVAESDQRIRSLWLSGSVARGTADAGSDLDLLLAIDDDHFEEFVAHWREWVGRVTTVLLAKTIPGSNLIFFALDNQMCRLDGVIEPVSRLPESPHRTRITVIDKDALSDRVPEPKVQSGPDPAKITALIEEFWRIESIFPAMVVDRKDLLCALSGVRAASQLLYDVFVESNQPLPPMGVKQFSARLTLEQREVLTAVPAAGADRESVIAANLAVCEAMSATGRSAAERVGARYPEVLAEAVQQHLRQRLGRE
jgi:hypothetical protein